MARFSGSSTFTFEVERYVDKFGNVYTEAEYDKLDGEDVNCACDYLTIKLSVTGSASHTPGRLYGPPEDCYPDDSESWIEGVKHPDGSDWSDKITESEKDAIYECLFDSIESDRDDGRDYDRDDYNDYDYDDYDYNL